MGNGAFVSCSSLENIKIPDSVRNIGSNAFSECGKLKNITIPGGVTTIEAWTFNLCTSLEKVTIQYGVTSIGDSAFKSCRSLKEIAIPKSVKSIGKVAFALCSSLETIEIPESVTSIENDAFRSCSSLENIYVNENNRIYKDMNGVLFTKDEKTIIIYPEGKQDAKYSIPSTVTSIGDYAFNNCMLNKIGLGSVKSIGNEAFRECEYLTNITIPSSVTSIGKNAFRYCRNLSKILVREANKYYESDDGILFTKNKKKIIKYPEGKNTKTYYKIPSSVTSIEEGVFENCTNLTRITIPDSVTSIGNDAFYNCSRLTSIIILNKVKSIGDNAFYGVSGPIKYYGANKAMKEYIKSENLSQEEYNKKYKRLDTPQITNLKLVSVEGNYKIYKSDTSTKIYIKKNSEINFRLIFGEKINGNDIDTSKIFIDEIIENADIIPTKISEIDITYVGSTYCNIRIKGGDNNGKIGIRIGEGFIKDEFGNKSKAKDNILPQKEEKLNIYLDNKAPELVEMSRNENEKTTKFRLKDATNIKGYKLTVYSENNDTVSIFNKAKDTLKSKEIVLTNGKVSKYHRVTVKVTDVLGNSETYSYDPYVKTKVKFVGRNENVATYMITTNVKAQIDESKIKNITCPDDCSVVSLEKYPNDTTGKKFLLKISTNSNSKSGTIKLEKETIYAYGANDEREAEIEIYMDNELPSIEYENLELENGKTKNISFNATFKDLNSGIKYYKIERTKTDEEKANSTDDKDIIVLQLVNVYKNGVQNEYPTNISFTKNVKYILTVEDYHGNITTEEFDVKNIDREKPEVKSIAFANVENDNYEVSIESNEIIQIVDTDGNIIDGWIANLQNVVTKTFNKSELEASNIIYLRDEAGNKTKINLQEEYTKYLNQNV